MQSLPQSSKGGPKLRIEAKLYLEPDFYSASSSAHGNGISMFFCNSGNAVQVEGNTAPKLN